MIRIIRNKTRSIEKNLNISKRSVRANQLNISQKINVNYSKIKFTNLGYKSRESNLNKHVMISKQSSKKTFGSPSDNKDILHLLAINKRKAKYFKNQSSHNLNLSLTINKKGSKKGSNYDRYKNVLTSTGSPVIRSRADIKHRKNLSLLNSGMGSLRNRNYVSF